MGRKDKKKGKGAEKTAIKTDKKINQKMKKELAAKGEVSDGRTCVMAGGGPPASRPHISLVYLALFSLIFTFIFWEKSSFLEEMPFPQK